MTDIGGVPFIGGWIRRSGDARARGKWHLVESLVADSVITRCGRRMEENNEKPLDSSSAMPLTRLLGQPQLCKRCQ